MYEISITLNSLLVLAYAFVYFEEDRITDINVQSLWALRGVIWLMVYMRFKLPIIHEDYWHLLPISKS